MARDPDITGYDEYIKSECWKCDKSPTGAHHWLLKDTVWVCKYCGDARIWPRTFADAVARTELTGTPYFSLVKTEASPQERNRVPMRKNVRR